MFFFGLSVEKSAFSRVKMAMLTLSGEPLNEIDRVVAAVEFTEAPNFHVLLFTPSLPE